MEIRGPCGTQTRLGSEGSREAERRDAQTCLHNTQTNTHTHAHANGSMTETATSVRAANVSVLRELPALFRDC